MSIPPHELVPKTPFYPGRRKASTSNVVLQRVVQIGQMMDVQGMSLTEIYEWNQRPKNAEAGELSGGGWHYSVREIAALMRKARDLGASLLHEDMRRNTIGVIRQLYDLKRKALAGGDFRVAFLCVREIARIRNVWPGNKPGRTKLENGVKPSMSWLEIREAPAHVEIEVTEQETMVGLS